MEIRIIDLPMITVIGKEGLCTTGKNIAQQLWQEANSHFNEVAALGSISLQGDYTLRALKLMLTRLRPKDGVNGLCQRENILL